MVMGPGTLPAPTTTSEPDRPSRAPARVVGRGDGRAAFGFLGPSVIGFMLFTLLPIAASIVLAFYEWPLLGTPHFAGLSNFVKLFTTDSAFHSVLLNTVYFVGAYLIANLVISLGLAVWLTSRIRGKSIFRLIFFLPVVTPMVANALVWKLLFNPGNGIFDKALHGLFGVNAPNWLGDSTWAMPAVVLMSVWAGFGYNMLVFVAGIESIPTSLYEAASIDSAGPWQRFWHVTLPMLSPSLFFATVMTLITSFQVFTQPYVLTGGGPGNSTSTLVLYLYQRGFQGFEMGYASAIAWVLFLIIMLITFIQFRAQKRWVHYD
jgi:multiple sugar transport system permease protein